MENPDVIETPLSARTLTMRSALMMMLFAGAFTLLMSGTYQLTHQRIEEAVQAGKQALLDQILDPSIYNNQLLNDTRSLPPNSELGTTEASIVWRARKNGVPTALVLEASAPDGYSGKIDLLVAVLVDGRVAGVRVVRHRETPGLGDYIGQNSQSTTAAHSHSPKQAVWIDQFTQQSLQTTPLAQWHVRKDNGVFDYVAGATISARAVTEAVGRTLKYASQNQAQLFAQALPEATSKNK